MDARARHLHGPLHGNRGQTVERCQEIMMLISQRVSVGVCAIVAGLLSACASSTEAPQAAAITITQGNQQPGFAGTTLPQALVVKVTDANGNPLANQVVDFSVSGGQGTVNPATDTTGVDGTASTQATPASTATTLQVTATVRSTTLSAIFTETVQPIAGSVNCTGTNTVTLALGEVRTAVSGNGICLQGPTGTSGFLVHAFFQSTVASSQTSVGIAGFGITAAPPPANRAPTTS